MVLRIIVALLVLVPAMSDSKIGEAEPETPVSLKTDTLRWRAPQLIVLYITPTDTFVTFGDYKYCRVEVREGRFAVSTVSDGEWVTMQCAGLPDLEFIYTSVAGLYGNRGEDPLRVISIVRESNEATVQLGNQPEEYSRTLLVDTTLVRIRRAYPD